MTLFRPLSRTFLITAMLAKAALLPASPALVYIGTFDVKGPDSGVYSARFDSDTGKLDSANLEFATQDPSWVSVSAGGESLFCGTMTDLGSGKSEGAVVSLSIDATSGKLKETSRQSNGTESACHVALSPDGKSLYAANYGNGFIASFPVKQGKILPVASRIQHKGSGPDKGRQEGPHVHQASPAPDGRFVFAPDLGTDRIAAYRVSGDSVLIPLPANDSATPAGYGPRHLTFSADGRFAYEITEMKATVRVHRYDGNEGKLTFVEEHLNVPSDFTGGQAGAEVVIHPNGRFLYASNRHSHESIAVYSIDPQTGKLTFIHHFQGGVKHPRHLVFDPTGRWMIFTNVFANNVAVVEVDAESGRIGKVASVLQLPQPSCVAFVK